MTRNLQQQLEITVSVDAPFATSGQAKAAKKALIPDNVDFPHGLSVKIFSKGNLLAIRLRSKNLPATTIVNTIEEMIEHVSISKKVMAS